MSDKEREELKIKREKMILDGIKDILELAIPIVLIILLMKM